MNTDYGLYYLKIFMIVGKKIEASNNSVMQYLKLF